MPLNKTRKSLFAFAMLLPRIIRDDHTDAYCVVMMRKVASALSWIKLPKISMTKHRSHRGDRLHLARQRFSAMLIDEVKDIAGMTLPQIDEALQKAGLRSKVDTRTNMAARYSHWLPGPDGRAPTAGDIQEFEDKVAAVLERPAHKVLVYRYIKPEYDQVEVLGAPGDRLDLGDASPVDLYLDYEDDWPTYRRLKADRLRRRIRGTARPDLIDLYAWQWGVLWKKTAEREPVFSWEEIGLPSEQSIAANLEELVRQGKREVRRWLGA
ncbi:hypothetical protein [Achromobacter aloeverae]|uniref:hypothetical protein n=1 Tax=Achromobacter aloeverae TaxID=1750518 RepID=UPI00100FE572|nr:hypothetical protein [Achromobacter aloeverae]